MRAGRQAIGHILISALAYAGAACVCMAALYLAAASNLSGRLSDPLYQRSRPRDNRIIIISIDDETLSLYGNVGNWDRQIYADLVHALTDDVNMAPRTLAFDILFSEGKSSEGDAAFADACKEARDSAGTQVITATSVSYKGQPEGGTFNPYVVEALIEPYEALRDVTSEGIVNTIIDDDGYVRQAPEYVNYGGSRIYGLATEAVRDIAPALPLTYGDDHRFYFSYSGGPDSYTRVPLCKVLDGTASPALFKDCIVFVGAYAVGMQDSYVPAVSHASQMYGVEIHAHIANAILDGRTQLPINRLLYALTGTIVCLAFLLVVGNTSLLAGLVLLILLTAGSAFLSVCCYDKGIYMPALALPILIAVCYVAMIVRWYIIELRRRRRVTGAFKSYVAPQVVDKISRDRTFEVSLGGETRDIAVLFVDIRGFTAMSESLPPQTVVGILNEYLALTTQCIFNNGGTLDKFIGDATMAVFNAPFDLDDYVYKAVRTAVDMRAGGEEIAHRMQEQYGYSIAFGIGVNLGPAVVGNIGCEFRMDYTAIGDTVNTAARLEAAAGSGQILISEAVYEQLGSLVEARDIGSLELKGKAVGVHTYEVISLA